MAGLAVWLQEEKVQVHEYISMYASLDIFKFYNDKMFLL